MPRKSNERGKIGKFYDDLGYSKNSAYGLEVHLAQLLNLAPEICRKYGITAQDVAFAKKINTKLGKINGWMYTRSTPLLPEDIR
jgi:hypothetical protein